MSFFCVRQRPSFIKILEFIMTDFEKEVLLYLRKKSRYSCVSDVSFVILIALAIVYTVLGILDILGVLG